MLNVQIKIHFITTSYNMYLFAVHSGQVFMLDYSFFNFEAADTQDNLFEKY